MKNSKSTEQSSDIALNRIKDFPNHPYKVKDDESMAELIDSIKNYGRPCSD